MGYAGGEIRTLNPSRGLVFETSAYTVPPHRLYRQLEGTFPHPLLWGKQYQNKGDKCETKRIFLSVPKGIIEESAVPVKRPKLFDGILSDLA